MEISAKNENKKCHALVRIRTQDLGITSESEGYLSLDNSIELFELRLIILLPTGLRFFAKAAT